MLRYIVVVCLLALCHSTLGQDNRHEDYEQVLERYRRECSDEANAQWNDLDHVAYFNGEKVELKNEYYNLCLEQKIKFSPEVWWKNYEDAEKQNEEEFQQWQVEYQRWRIQLQEEHQKELARRVAEEKENCELWDAQWIEYVEKNPEFREQYEQTRREEIEQCHKIEQEEREKYVKHWEEDMAKLQAEFDKKVQEHREAVAESHRETASAWQSYKNEYEKADE